MCELGNYRVKEMRVGRGSKKIEREGGNVTSQIFVALHLEGFYMIKVLCDAILSVITHLLKIKFKKYRYI